MNVVASYRDQFQAAFMATTNSHGIAYGQSALALRSTPRVGHQCTPHSPARRAANLAPLAARPHACGVTRQVKGIDSGY